MNKFISLVLFLIVLINVIASQSSSSSDDVMPVLLTFFSNDPSRDTLFKLNRVDLEDGSLNITIYTKYTGYGKMLGVTGYDGVNWFDYQFKTDSGSFDFFDGGVSDLGQGDTSAAWLNADFYETHPAIVDFNPHPIGMDDARREYLSVGWSMKTQELLILGFNYGNYNMFFYYNSTQYQVSPTYQNSLTQCYDYDQSLMYINYINPTTTQRQILVYQPFNLTDALSVDEYSFEPGTDLTKSTESNVYLFYSAIVNQNETPLYMVEVANVTGTNSTINLLSVGLSATGYTASSNIILSLDNSYGSNIDGIPFCYLDQHHQFLILLSKPTSTMSYTITTVDLINNYKTTSITTDVVDFYNYGLYYQDK
ncbi:hypothetical protein RB653_008887 [Dictyostelium firmibasis]|uniref:Uncharacterized protein n=1 Tax=Dictyostelium firmibasis TaxID=79012 RepID=A0AAN7U1B8_9MYCE